VGERANPTRDILTRHTELRKALQGGAIIRYKVFHICGTLLLAVFGAVIVLQLEFETGASADTPITAIAQATEKTSSGSSADSDAGEAAHVSATPNFEDDVAPLFREFCWKCHGGRGLEAKLDLRTLPLILKGGDHGAVLVAGSAEKSALYRHLSSGAMPPAYEEQPTDANIRTIRRWIDGGAPAQYEGGPLTEEEEPTVTKDDRQWWAFQSPNRPTVPLVRQLDRLRSPIDAFVLARLEQQGLEYSADVDRTTLVRRVFLDLIGLPPGPDEVDRFVNDGAPDAYARLIDRLLASPHYGERWGRHWLDAAGYVDTTDDDQQAKTVQARNGIWRYRDYVIRSFNHDTPYDQFLREQLAGDEMIDWRFKPLDERSQELLVATGFLRQSPDVTNNEDRDVASSRYQVLYDTVEIVSSNLLGLTMKCAQCHTHKFDPISNADYYRLIAIFRPAYNPQRWLVPRYRNLTVQNDKGRDVLVQALWDLEPTAPTYLHRRGNFEQPGAIVEPGVIAVLDDPDSPFRPPSDDPRRKTTGNRTALARWLTKPNHPLTARVIVNRVWQHYFGRGIVATPDNFGLLGSPPTHPQLLDWLAREFVESGWSFKQLHRLILSSTVYRQASQWGTTRPLAVGAEQSEQANPETVDAENELLWRMPLRRLESEVVRDSILAVNGMLIRAMGGSPVPLAAKPDGTVEIDASKPGAKRSTRRRSIYLFSRRNYPLTELQVFDQPIGDKNCLRRKNSAVVSQSLMMLNSKFVFEQSDVFARRVIAVAAAERDSCIRTAFRLALARSPSAEELQLSRELLDTQTARVQSEGKQSTDQAAHSALVSLCRMLYNTNEFLYAE